MSAETSKYDEPEVSAAELESFERAFSDGGGGCVRQCRCGMTFFNSDGGWDWNDGELEQLEKWQKEGKARDMPWAVGYLDFEGGQWVSDCDCWKPRAKRIINWLKGHGEHIAEFFSLEKKRQVAEAARLPEVVTR